MSPTLVPVLALAVCALPSRAEQLSEALASEDECADAECSVSLRQLRGEQKSLQSLEALGEEHQQHHRELAEEQSEVLGGAGASPGPSSAAQPSWGWDWSQAFRPPSPSATPAASPAQPSWAWDWTKGLAAPSPSPGTAVQQQPTWGWNWSHAFGAPTQGSGSTAQQQQQPSWGWNWSHAFGAPTPGPKPAAQPPAWGWDWSHAFSTPGPASTAKPIWSWDWSKVFSGSSNSSTPDWHSYFTPPAGKNATVEPGSCKKFGCFDAFDMAHLSNACQCFAGCEKTWFGNVCCSDYNTTCSNTAKPSKQKSSAPDDVQIYKSAHCHSGHGAKSLGPMRSFKRRACRVRCIRAPKCTGFVVNKEGTQCGLLSDIDIPQCEVNEKFITVVFTMKPPRPRQGGQPRRSQR